MENPQKGARGAAHIPYSYTDLQLPSSTKNTLELELSAA